MPTRTQGQDTKVLGEGTSPESLHDSALALLIEGDFAGGASVLEAYLASVPTDAAAWFELGTANLALERLSDAVASFERALELEPNHEESRICFAQALSRQGAVDRALFQLEEAQKRNPQSLRVEKELGITCYEAKRYEQAVLHLTTYLAARPSDARGHYALGLAYEATRDLGAAIVAYRAAVREDPRLLAAQRTLADALASLGEHEEAMQVLENIVAIDRHDEQAAKNYEVLSAALAEMRRRRLLGKPEKALAESALVEEGGLVKRGEVREGGDRLVRFAAPLVELFATFDARETMTTLFLSFPDPDRAARAEEDRLGVTIVSTDGQTLRPDLLVAVTLTFLREALGCPMTKAGELYRALLARPGDALDGSSNVTWGGAVARFDRIRRPDKPNVWLFGIRVELVHQAKAS